MRALAAIGLGLAMLTTPARAALLGTDVTVHYNYAALTPSLDVVTVGAGVELTCPSAASLCTMLSAPTQMVDIDDLSIGYSYNGPSPGGFDNVLPNGFLFDGLMPGGEIVGYQLSTGIPGLDASRISFGADWLAIDMHNLPLGYSNYFTVTLEVPEPASLGLFGLGMLGVVGLRRRG